MRSLAASSSGSSEEMIRTALPDLASSRISVDDLAPCVPMSMPAVGSSRISTSGSVASHLAITTFCALPPESERTGLSGEAVLIRSRWIVLLGEPLRAPGR